MYTNNNYIQPSAKSLIVNATKFLLEKGKPFRPSDIKTITKSTLPIPIIQGVMDELHARDLTIRRNITTEGVHITFTYSRVITKPIEQPKPEFGFITNLDLSKYDSNLYVAYHSHGEYPAAIFNTTDKYDARNQYKALTGVRHNDVRMTKLETYLKK